MTLFRSNLQAAIAWTFTAFSVAPIFLFVRVPIGMPVASPY